MDFSARTIKMIGSARAIFYSFDWMHEHRKHFGYFSEDLLKTGKLQFQLVLLPLAVLRFLAVASSF